MAVTDPDLLASLERIYRSSSSGIRNGADGRPRSATDRDEWEANVLEGLRQNLRESCKHFSITHLALSKTFNEALNRFNKNRQDLSSVKPHSIGRWSFFLSAYGGAMLYFIANQISFGYIFNLPLFISFLAALAQTFFIIGSGYFVGLYLKRYPEKRAIPDTIGSIAIIESIVLHLVMYYFSDGRVEQVFTFIAFGISLFMFFLSVYFSEHSGEIIRFSPKKIKKEQEESVGRMENAFRELERALADHRHRVEQIKCAFLHLINTYRHEWERVSDKVYPIQIDALELNSVRYSCECTIPSDLQEWPEIKKSIMV